MPALNFLEWQSSFQSRTAWAAVGERERAGEARELRERADLGAMPMMAQRAWESAANRLGGGGAESGGGSSEERVVESGRDGGGGVAATAVLALC